MASNLPTSNDHDEWPLCIDHSRKISIWCISCEFGICSDCMEKNHSDHDFRSYKDLMKKRAGVFLDEISHAATRLKYVDGDIARHQLQMSYLEQEISERKSKLDEHKAKVERLTDERKRYLPLFKLKQPFQSVVQKSQIPSGNNLHSYFAKSSLVGYKIDKVSFAFEQTFPLTNPSSLGSLQKSMYQAEVHRFANRRHQVHLEIEKGFFLFSCDQHYRIYLLNNSPEKTICQEFRNQSQYLEIPQNAFSDRSLGWISNAGGTIPPEECIRLRVEVLNLT